MLSLSSLAFLAYRVFCGGEAGEAGLMYCTICLLYLHFTCIVPEFYLHGIALSLPVSLPAGVKPCDLPLPQLERLEVLVCRCLM